MLSGLTPKHWGNVLAEAATCDRLTSTSILQYWLAFNIFKWLLVIDYRDLKWTNLETIIINLAHYTDKMNIAVQYPLTNQTDLDWLNCH